MQDLELGNKDLGLIVRENGGLSLLTPKGDPDDQITFNNMQDAVVGLVLTTGLEEPTEKDKEVIEYLIAKTKVQ